MKMSNIENERRVSVEGIEDKDITIEDHLGLIESANLFDCQKLKEEFQKIFDKLDHNLLPSLSLFIPQVISYLDEVKHIVEIHVKKNRLQLLVAAYICCEISYRNKNDEFFKKHILAVNEAVTAYKNGDKRESHYFIPAYSILARSRKKYYRSQLFDIYEKVERKLYKSNKSKDEILFEPVVGKDWLKSKEMQLYMKYPVPGMDIVRVQKISSPILSDSFKSARARLGKRQHSIVFQPNWEKQKEKNQRDISRIKALRRFVSEKKDELVKEHHSMFFENDKHLNIQQVMLWHGTKKSAVASIAECGLANLALTDEGYFGKGIYGTSSAEYAYRYSTYNPEKVAVGGGPILLLNQVVFYSAYPVIYLDQQYRLSKNKSNIGNYDAHFSLVRPVSSRVNEMVFDGILQDRQYRNIELCVFESSQCIPRYMIEFRKSVPERAFSCSNLNLFFNKKDPELLLNAARYVHQKFLKLPYTNPYVQFDWEYVYQGEIISRPNHGLAHSLRKARYVKHAIECYIEYNNLDKTEARNLRVCRKPIELALLFSVVGRENDCGSGRQAKKAEVRNRLSQDHQRYKHHSMKAFESFMLVNQLAFKDNSIFKILKASIKNFYRKRTHIENIMSICHDLDTMRCFAEKGYERNCARVANFVGRSNMVKLRDLAQIMCVYTGNRILGLGRENEQGYNPKLFINCNKSADFCTQRINLAVASWENRANSVHTPSSISLLN